MPIGEVVAIGGLVLALLASVWGALAFAYKSGGLIATLTAAVAAAQKQSEACAQVPALVIRIGQLESLWSEAAPKLNSEFPKMRERLSSVTDDVEDIRDARLPERLAVVEERGRPPRPTPQQMPRTTIPRKDPDE